MSAAPEHLFAGKAKGTADFSTLPFKLDSGDEITDCHGLWHRCGPMTEDLAKCHGCNRPAFRVVTITSEARLERRAALCGSHFIAAGRVFPQLRRTYGSMA